MQKGLNFDVVHKVVDTEILLKLCVYLPVESCAEGARHQNIQKTTLNASRNHTNFAAYPCRKV